MQTLLDNPAIPLVGLAAALFVLLTPFRLGWMVAVLGFVWADSAMPGAELARRPWARIAVLVLVGIHGATRLRSRGRAEAPPAPALLLLVLCAVSLLWAEPLAYPAGSTAFLALLVAVAFALVARLAYSPSAGLATARRLVHLLLLVIVVGLLPWGRSEGLFVEGTGRLRGFFNNPNGLGITCAICAPLVAVDATRAAGRRRLVGWAAVVGLAALAFLSGSRTGFGGVLAGVSVALFTRHPSKYLAGAAIVGLLAGLATLAKGDIDLEEGATGNLIRGQTISRLSGRADRWGVGLEMWRENPVLGAGYMTSRRIQFVETRADGTPGPDTRGQGVNFHSQHVETLVDQGILGECLLVALGATLLARARRLARAVHEPDAAALGAVYLGVLTAVALDSFFHNWLLTPGSPFALVLWSLTAVALRVERAVRPERARAVGDASAPALRPAGAGASLA